MPRKYNNDNSDLLTAVIEIKNVEWKENLCSIETSRGQFFSFFALKVDGETPTKADITFQELLDGGDEDSLTGQKVAISYTEKPSKNPSRPYKNIMWFEPVLEGTPVSEKAPPKAAPTYGKRTPEQQEAAEAKFQAEIIGKMAFGFLEAGIQSGNITIQTAREHVDTCVMLAERLYDASQGPTSKKPRRLPEPEPVVEEEEEPERKPLPKTAAAKAAARWKDDPPPF